MRTLASLALMALATATFTTTVLHAETAVSWKKETRTPSSEQVQAELEAVVRAQLDAFREDDYFRAFQYAANELQMNMDVMQFEVMVKSGYPIIARGAVRFFCHAYDTGNEAVMDVEVVDGKRNARYRYVLRKQLGEWKVSGVREVESPGLTV